MRHKHLGALLALTILAAATGCTTGSGSSTTVLPAPAPASGTFTVTSGGSTPFDLPGVGTTTAGTTTLGAPTAGGGATGTFSVSASNPTATSLSADKRTAAVAPATGVWYLTLTFNQTVSVAALPSFTLEFATPQSGVVFHSAIYNGTSWTEPWSGPGTLTNGGSTLTIPAKAATPYTFTAGTSYVLAIYSTALLP